MITKFLPLFFSLLFSWTALNAQQVSTLITDSDRLFDAMHWHEDGRIYAVDYLQGQVYQIFLDGTIETVVSGFDLLAGGGFDQEGNFYFSAIGLGIVFRLNPDNTYTEIASGFKQPVTILADRNDNDICYVTEFGNSKVTKFSKSTGTTTPFASGNGILGPAALFYDWSGENLLVSNWSNHNIHQIDAAGNVTLFTKVPGLGMMGYATIVGDYLYVSSHSRRKLYRVDQEGNATLIAGTNDQGHTDGPGESATFYRPIGICHNFAGDTILLSDDHTIRIITDFEPKINTNISEEIVFENFSINPNPSTDFLNITFSLLENNPLTWNIYDQQGRSVQTGQFDHFNTQENSFTIPIQELDQGMYTIQFFTERKKSTAYHFIKIIE